MENIALLNTFPKFLLRRVAIIPVPYYSNECKGSTEGSKDLEEEIMTENQTPETFVVGETVTFYRGDDRYSVEVIGVDGDVVRAKVFGEVMVFTPRASDGMHVKLGSPDFEVMPDMIYHPEPVEPVKVSFWKRIANLFS